MSKANSKPAARPKIDTIQRTQKLIDFDNSVKAECPGYLCGVDEAGRGPVAGPVVAAAVVFSDDVFIDGVFDSKQVPEAKREELFDEIRSSALAYGIGIVPSEEIDKINILNATKRAMDIAVSKLAEQPAVIIADGNFYASAAGGTGAEIRNVIKADEKSFAAAAASILAKVTRDRIMCEYQNEFPNFTFSLHKGYCTIAHLDEILEYGYTKIHRRSFRLKAVQQELFG